MLDIFKHFQNAKKLYGTVIAPVCDKYGLTNMEFSLLMFLHNNPQYDTASMIVKYRNLAKSHVSITVRSLQEKGLVDCNYLNDDRRTIHLSVTALADAIIADGKIRQEEYKNMLFEGFSDERLDELSECIEKIDDNILNNLTK